MQVDLTWTAPTSGSPVTAYQLERCQGAACSTFAPVVPAPTGTTYSDTGLTASTSYSYRVLATSAAGPSGYSATVTTTTQAPPPPNPPGAPTNLTATTASSTEIDLTWVASMGGGVVTGYDVERCQGAGCSTFAPLPTQTGTGTTYKNTGLSPSTSYTYRARGTGAGGPSGYTATATATTQPAPPPSAGGTPTFVQVNAGVPQSTVVQSVSVAYTAAQSIGNLNVIVVGWGDATAAVSSVSDLSGNTYALAVGPTVGTGVSQSIYYATNIVGSSGGNTVTVVFTTPASYPDVRILEYSGIDSTNPLDGIVATTGNSAVSSTGALTTINSYDLLLAANWVDTVTTAAGAPFASRIISNPDADLVEDLVVSSTGTYTATASLGGSGPWVMQMVAFRAGGSAAPPATPPTVVITSPISSSLVTGNVSIKAFAAGYSPIAGTQFQLDGANLGAEVTTAPYTLNWDTTTVTPGTMHTLTAVVRDVAGRTATSTPVTVTPTTPATAGQWGAPLDTPIVSVHSMLLPDGKVLMMDGQDSGMLSRVWDMATNVFTIVNAPVNIFCSALTTLANGTVFEAGGHANTAHTGLPTTNLFSFLTEQWKVGPNMANARWYPSAQALPDGRVLVLAGERNCDRCDVLTPEIYDPVTNTMSLLAGADKDFTYYPFTFVLPDGKVLVAGSEEYPLISQVLDINARTWTPVGGPAVEGGTAVQYSPGKILKTATSVNPDAPLKNSVGDSYVLDMNQANPTWRKVGSLALPRTYASSVVMPDGNVFIGGGGSTSALGDPAGAVYDAEIWSPSTETWTTVAPMSTPRLYHSEALLMPDGRIMMAGGGRFTSAVTLPTDRFSAEFYSPPYLFKGARPTVTSAPNAVTYGQSFVVQTPDAAQIASVSLIRLGSATHAHDLSSHYVPLSFTQTAGGLQLQAPASGNLAEPGYYMLFIVNTNGVPSVAPIINVS